MSTSDPMRQSKMLPMPVRQSTRLPPAFPQLPDTAVLGKDPAARKAALDSWQSDVRAWWKTARFAMQQDYEELSQGANTSINKGNALDTALRTEVQARNDGDATLLTQIQSLVLSTGPNRIFAQSIAPANPQVNDLWFDTDDGFHPWYYDGAGWVDARDGAISGAVAAITTEQTNRIAGDLAQSARTDAILNRIDDPATGIAAMATTLDSVTTQVSTVAGDVTAQGQRVANLEVAIAGPNGDDGIAAKVAEIAQSYVDADEAAAAAATAITASIEAPGTAGTIGNYVTTAVSTEATARTTADTSLGSRCTDLESRVHSGAGNLTARVTAIENTYATETEAGAIARTEISASLASTSAGTIGAAITTINNTFATKAYADSTATSKISASISSTAAGTIGAAIQSEATVRASADGNLSGKYTLAVDTGGVVTGMNITSTTSGGVTTSNIQFQADKFQIYNGTSGSAPFEVAGGVVYIKSASIRNLSAGVITTGTLSAIAISGVTISGTIITGGTISGALISGATITGATINAATGMSAASGQFDRLEVGTSGGYASQSLDSFCLATLRNGLNVGRSSNAQLQTTFPSGAVYAKSLDISSYTTGVSASTGPRVTVGTTATSGEIKTINDSGLFTTISGPSITTTTITANSVTSSTANITTVTTGAVNVGTSGGSNPANPFGATISSGGAIRGVTFYGLRCIGNVNAGMYLCATDGVDVRTSAITEGSAFSTTDFVARMAYDSANTRMTLTSKATSGMYFDNQTSGDFRFNTTAAKRIRFGEYTAGGVGLSIGYIIIKDSAGTERKLVVCA